ncbi:unnamed protein product [Mytilus coruscus]|uniref:Reverse transcriptase domain-containing protein n=1 Tax=Mytilus coruscus TaxID=42192 RepID=A0A6J8ABW0_MYTCO|nr:unnamed protein product [Mytilus coruscus]
MDLNENDSEGFYQLIRKQRDSGNTCASAFTKCIFKDEIVNTDPEIREAWDDYFYDQATPSENPNFDPIFKDNVEKDVQNLHKYFSEENQQNIEHSPDELNISAEHLKYGGSLLISVLAYIINFLFKHVHIIKSGIVCPVFKNGGKPKDDPNSYRKITITSSVGKVVEKIHLSRNEDKILVKQSNLQKGFIKGESPCIAALIITELIIEAKKKKSSLYIALMDERKAFDILWHLGLLREMHKTGLEGNNWLFFENWYTELTSKVKWKGEFSHQIIEQQGERQGSIWSPSAHKLFVNSLLTRKSNWSHHWFNILWYTNYVIKLTTEDIKNLSIYFRKILRQIQHLPDRTANVASHLLLGRITIESEIHKRILKTFGNIIRNENSIERKLAIRQLATKSLQWFTKTVEIANIYDLPSPYDTIDNPPRKQLWKNLVNKTVGDHCIKQMINEAQSKSTLA